MTVITLLTDFGLRDGYVGVMKGVIWGIAPHAQIADLTHAIAPQNVAQGALALKRTAKYFPDGTIHVAVVDPGVGTSRRPLAARVGRQVFVGPDNGLFSLVLEGAERAGEAVHIIHLTERRFWLPEVSRVFHGRDIFSPVAAHLANGVNLDEMGPQLDGPVRLDLPRPEQLPGGGWRGQVIEVDYFGNLSTNLERSHIERIATPIVQIVGHEIHGLVGTFGDRPAGNLIALFGTADDLVIAEVNGNAAKTLGIGLGAQVTVLLGA